MKLVPMEVTDPEAMPWTLVCEQDMTLGGKRPLATEADWIAAAKPMGIVVIRRLADLIDDTEIQAYHDKYCELCSTDPGTVTEYWNDWHKQAKAELEFYDVEWDPTIRF